MGHLLEMLGPEGDLGATVKLDAVPLLPGALAHAGGGMIPGGAYRNREAQADRVDLAAGVDDNRVLLLFDPQTSGGLLGAVPPEAAEAFEAEAGRRGVEARRIGFLDASGRISVTS